MSEGKQNYERQKARREKADKLNEARQFSQNAEMNHTLLFLGACLIQEREAEAPHKTAETLFKLTKPMAAALASQD